MKRREFIGALGAGIATTGLGIRSAVAQAGPLIVSNYGGSWGKAQVAAVDTRFEKQFGMKVVQDTSGSPIQRITKLQLGLTGPQTTDIIQLNDGNWGMAIKLGVVEPIDKSSPRLSALQDVVPTMVNDYFVPNVYSAIVLVYNKKHVSEPPTSYADLWNPKYAGRIVVPDVTHSVGPEMVPLSAIAAGKAPTDDEAGFEMLKRLSDLNPIWAKSTDQMANAFRTEEAVIGLCWTSRTFGLQDAGVPVEMVFPKEGAIFITWGHAIVKNSANKAAAEDYINTTLDLGAQADVVDKLSMAGSNNKLGGFVPENKRIRAAFTDDQLKQLIYLDRARMTDLLPGWVDRVSQIIAGG